MNMLKTGAIAAFAAAIAFFSGCTDGKYFKSAVGGPKFKRIEDFSPVRVGARERRAEKPLFFAEFQYKYGLYQNYLHNWIDRPLFYDRALRPETFQFETQPSFAIHAREVLRAGLDGFNAFSIKGRKESIFKLYDRWLDEAGLDDFAILPTLGYGEDGRTYANFDGFSKVISEAMTNSRFPRINGVPVFSTYGYRVLKPAAHRELEEKLRKKFGANGFILPGDVDGALFSRLKKSYRERGSISAEEAAELERAMDETLALSGGLQLAIDAHQRDFAGAYCTRYDYTFFDNCILPVLEKVFAKPANAGKILGFYVYQGYINHMSGVNLAEECTGTLRRCLRSVLKANPDYLMFFEWNEVNENTMFQPTVWGGTLAPRIMRWHARLAKGLAPDPFPGDDTGVPTLALSHRATAKVGEQLHFEILNIPDGVYRRQMKVQLQLRDCSRRVVAAFPVEKIDSCKFGTVEYIVDTTSLGAGEALEPTLVVDGKEYAGFSPIRISPTISWNYKSVRMHLRDLMKAENCEISIAADSGGAFGFRCKGGFGEELASLELVENESVHGAMGSEQEFDFTNNIVIRLAVTTPSAGASYGPFSVVAKNAKGPLKASSEMRPNVNPGTPRMHKDNLGFSLSTFFWSTQIAYILQLPKTDVESAVLEVARPDMKGYKTAKLPLKDIAELGEVGAVLNENTAFRVDAKRVYAVPDLPGHIGSSAVDWSGSFESRTPQPVYHFRAISKSGKIWRSRPFCPCRERSETLSVNVFDEFSGSPATVEMPKNQVPVFDYKFDPRSQAAFVNAFDPFYNGHLGAGFHYSEAYCDSRIKVKPGDRQPKWVEENGRWTLEFDGENDYINFPKEAFPQAAFTLELELKADFSAAGTMTIFRHYSFTRGSISVFARNGKLYATWGDKILTREPHIPTPLEFRDNEWNKLSISYDFNKFTFVLNSERYEFEWAGRPWRFMQSIFGGHDRLELAPGKVGSEPKYFKGRLRKLTIYHRQSK